MFCCLSCCYLELLCSWYSPFNALWWSNSYSKNILEKQVWEEKMNVVKCMTRGPSVLFLVWWFLPESSGRLQEWLQRHCCNYTKASLMVALAAFWLSEFRVCFESSKNSTTFNGSLYYSFNKCKRQVWWICENCFLFPACIKNLTVKTGKNIE